MDALQIRHTSSDWSCVAARSIVGAYRGVKVIAALDGRSRIGYVSRIATSRRAGARSGIQRSCAVCRGRVRTALDSLILGRASCEWHTIAARR